MRTHEPKPENGVVKLPDGRSFEEGSAELVCAQIGYSGDKFQYCVEMENKKRARNRGENLHKGPGLNWYSGGKRRKSRKNRKSRKSRKSRKQRRN